MMSKCNRAILMLVNIRRRLTAGLRQAQRNSSKLRGVILMEVNRKIRYSIKYTDQARQLSRRRVDNRI
jgi:hypothetical protein